jgi:hypothetical protein
VTALADRLAARTLELVDIHSESLHEHAIRQHLLALVPPTLHAEWIGDEAALFVPDRRAGVPSSSSRATTTPSPHRATCPVASRTAPFTASVRAT